MVITNNNIAEIKSKVLAVLLGVVMPRIENKLLQEMHDANDCYLLGKVAKKFREKIKIRIEQLKTTNELNEISYFFKENDLEYRMNALYLMAKIGTLKVIADKLFDQLLFIEKKMDKITYRKDITYFNSSKNLIKDTLRRFNIQTNS